MSDDYMADLNAHRAELEANALLVSSAIEAVILSLEIEKRFILPVVMIVTLRMIDTILYLTAENDRDEMLSEIIDEAKKILKRGFVDTNDLAHRETAGRA